MVSVKEYYEGLHLKFHISRLISVMVLVAFFSACRTVHPRDESLDVGSSDQGTSRLDSLQLESDGSGGVPLVWSPEERKINATFQYIVAQKMIVRGDIKQALPLLESSYNLDPNSYIGSQLVEARLLNGNLEEAKTESHRMTILYPMDDKLRLQYGQVLVFLGDLKGAEFQFLKAIELNPHNEDAYLMQAKLLVASKRPNEGIALMQRLVKQFPETSKGWPMLTKLLIGARRFKEALEPAKRSWNLQQGRPEAAFLYGLTLDLNGQQKEAVALYEQLYRLNPSSPEIIQRMVALYQEIGNMEEALSLVDEMILKTKQNHPGLIMQRAIILSELNRHEEASKALEALLLENPDSDRVLFMSGLALERIGNFDEAVVRYLRIADDSPVKLASEYRRALILKQNKKISESVGLLQALTQRSDADSISWQLLIEVLADSQRYDEAIVAAEKGFKAFPDKIQLLFLKGVYEEKSSKLGDAELTMRDVIKRSPDHASALNFLGYMLAEQNRELVEAEKLVQRALKIKPDDGSFLDSLGWVYYQKKDYKKALEILKNAQKASPKEGAIWEHVGDAQLQLNDYMSAFQSYESALQTELEERDRVRINGKLKETRLKVK